MAKYLGRRTGPPSQSWRTFLANHAADLASIDFFTVPTATFRVLFVFVVLSHDALPNRYRRGTAVSVSADLSQQAERASPSPSSAGRQNALHSQTPGSVRQPLS